MNKLTIIGNLCKDPELRTTQDGISVCSFDVAVNRRKKSDGTQDVDYFHVNAWRALGENCAKYLTKGSKVAVVGPVSVRKYETKDGKHGASLEVHANDVEFCSRKETQETGKVDEQTGYQQVQPDDDFPY